MTCATPDAVGHIRSGDIKAIGVLARTRSAILPDLATADEQGLPGVEANSRYGLFLPNGVPAAIVRRLAPAAGAAADTGVLRERLRGLGVDIVPPERRGSDQLARFIGEEYAKWSVPIRATGSRWSERIESGCARARLRSASYGGQPTPVDVPCYMSECCEGWPASRSPEGA